MYICLVVGRTADFTADVEALVATGGRVIMGFSTNLNGRVIKEEEERRTRTRRKQRSTGSSNNNSGRWSSISISSSSSSSSSS